MTYSKEFIPHCAVIGLRGFPDIQGGVEKHCEALYPRIKGFRFTVFRRKPYLPPKAPKNWNGINFIDLPSTRIKGFEALFHTFIAAIKAIAIHPDIILIHNIGPGIFAPLIKAAGIPVITTYHSANYEHKKWGLFGRTILRFGEKMSLNFSDHIIFVNQAKYNALSPQIKKKSSLIVNGVETPIPSAKTDFLDKLGIKPGHFLLAVGRLTPEKGFEHLINAVNNNDLVEHLVIAGGSDHDSTYLTYLRKLDTKRKIIFTGNLQGEPLRQLYSHAYAFVLSSVTEGFPLVLLEAMSYRLPVIVSQIPATDPLKFIPKSRFFKPANPESLSEAISRLFKDITPGQRIDYPLEQYDWKNIALKTATLLNRYCSKYHIEK
ncbi:MAG: glycosyltransferase family 4 protein [Prevotella sp.]|nr:glycosyltransferase family 4 protein [Bacteroides sp.]MCM1367066.1 glycosyltransferase family 4 protein [Prevotella sp.]MCM1437035.1 glycosyltransferase family 4 protein [Prevotella sp.]